MAEAVAELKHTTAEEVIRVTEENARRFYRLERREADGGTSSNFGESAEYH